MRPQLGSEPATAVFTSGELAMARAMRAAPSSLGAPETIDGDQLPRAFAIARDGPRQRFHHAGDRLFHLGHLLRVGPHAGSAVGQQHQRVVGGSVAIHARAGCSCAPPRASACARSSADRESAASVITKPSVVAMRGWIMPEPLVMPAMRTVPRRSFTSREGRLGDQVGGHDGARRVVESRPSRRPATSRGSASDDLSRIQFHADHAGGGGQHLRHRHAAAVSRRPCRWPAPPRRPCAWRSWRCRHSPGWRPPGPCESFRWRRHSFTGAACTRFCVNTAAAAAGRPETIRARSSFCACRMPA